MRVRQEEDEEEEEMVTRTWTALKERKVGKEGKPFLDRFGGVMNERKVMRIVCVVLGAVLLFYIYRTSNLNEEILESNRIEDSLLLAEANTF